MASSVALNPQTPSGEFFSVMVRADDNNLGDCAVCRQPFQRKQHVITHQADSGNGVAQISHNFHDPCFFRGIIHQHNACSICRTKITSINGVRFGVHEPILQQRRQANQEARINIPDEDSSSSSSDFERAPAPSLHSDQELREASEPEVSDSEPEAELENNTGLTNQQRVSLRIALVGTAIIGASLVIPSPILLGIGAMVVSQGFCFFYCCRGNQPESAPV